MPCPRCGNKDIMGSKATILGKQPEVAPGVRTGDVVAYSYYCPKCTLLEEASTDSPDEVTRLDQRWESVPQLEQEVVWNETNDPFEPCVAIVDGQEWRLRANDFPRHDRYTLFVAGAEVFSFNHWPTLWLRPHRVRP